jgi:hypothetical protein
MSVLCLIDDKHVPLYRILWVSAVPHFCGSEDCQREGQYEVRLEQGETVWASRQERDAVLEALEAWGAPGHTDDGCQE